MPRRVVYFFDSHLYCRYKNAKLLKVFLQLLTRLDIAHKS